MGNSHQITWFSWCYHQQKLSNRSTTEKHFAQTIIGCYFYCIRFAISNTYFQHYLKLAIRERQKENWTCDFVHTFLHQICCCYWCLGSRTVHWKINQFLSTWNWTWFVAAKKYSFPLVDIFKETEAQDIELAWQLNKFEYFDEKAMPWNFSDDVQFHFVQQHQVSVRL